MKNRSYSILLLLVAAIGTQAATLPPIPGGRQETLSVPELGPVPQEPVFSANPTDEEFYKVRVFAEPLIPIGRQTTPNENDSLAKALLKFSNRVAADDHSSLEKYLEKHPSSPWRASLLACLGNEYYHCGAFSKAREAWILAWGESKTASDLRSKAVADQAFGELVKMHARIGEFQELELLLNETGQRKFSGVATEKVSGAKQALWAMKNTPGIAFKCGPLALNSILRHQKSPKKDHKRIIEARSTQQGFSFEQVRNLANELGMGMQVGFRNGGDLVVPSVVHWKVGHYAAVLDQQGSRFLLRDPTFGKPLWVTRKTLESEASGYFLIPGPIPPGWRSVPDSEAGTVFGKGTTSGSNPRNSAPYDAKARSDCGSGGMAVYNAHLMLVSLNITDTPIGFQPPRGDRVEFTLTYNQREDDDPANFAFSNLGSKWSHNWMEYIEDDPNSPNATVEHHIGGGGSEIYEYDAGAGAFPQHWKTHSKLTRTDPDTYELLFPDGSKRVFAQPDGSQGTDRKVFLSKVVDPLGNQRQLNYDPNLRLATITDPVDSTTFLTFAYGPGGMSGDMYKIKKVTDQFGREANFYYSNLDVELTNVVDVINLSSQFTYNGHFIEKLVTPYGESTFSFGEGGAFDRLRWLEMIDAKGNTSRVEYNEYAHIGTPHSEPGPTVPVGIYSRNSYIYARTTYYWDEKAFHEGREDYTKARQFHWLHSNDGTAAIGTLESIKEPLENRVWFNYPGQTSDYSATYAGDSSRPSKIARVVDDGSTQTTEFDWNSFGNLLKSIDPVGREFTHVYEANGIDLKEIRQTRNGANALIASFTYNSQHQPLTYVDAAGQTNQFIYNSFGQIRTNINALGHQTVFGYDADGFLQTIDGPLSGTNDTISLTYDAFNRVHTVTDSEGYTVTTIYDDFDRPLTNSFPDGTFESFTYDRLHLDTHIDREGNETKYEFNDLRQLEVIREATNWVTRLVWCRCGDLEKLTDPLGQTTSWHYDLQGRLKSKEYMDKSKVAFTYEDTTSRLRNVEDERGQFKWFTYFADGNIDQITYSNVVHTTPNVSFTYDPDYNRVATMLDGEGTTTYSYNPITSTPTLGAGNLGTTDGPFANDIVSYQYDALGRATNRAINGVSVRTTFDEIGRATIITNALGTFTQQYTNATDRLKLITYPNGINVVFDYFDNNGDQLLSEIKNLTSTQSIISKFNYGYTPEGQITNWTAQAAAQAAQESTLTYNAINELTNSTVRVSGSVTESFDFSYDLAGNRTNRTTTSSTQTLWFNPLNQPLGMETSDTPSIRTYEWDGENRLYAINSGTLRTEIRYDGLGRRSRIIEKDNGVVTDENTFLWCGFELCEERDSSGGATTKRFFPLGEQHGSLNLYHTFDHLGSIRELTDSVQTVRARYDYSPYGKQSKISGDLESEFGFTGHYTHSPSGLSLAPLRELDPSLGRWLSRDPIGENGGRNLYSYVFNDPINFIDPLGACAATPRNRAGGGSGGNGNRNDIALGFRNLFGKRGQLSQKPIGPSRESLAPFARNTNSRPYWEWGPNNPDLVGMRRGLLGAAREAISKGGKIRFNLDGFRNRGASIRNAVRRGQDGTGKITEQELSWVLRDPVLRANTIFYRGGKIISNPQRLFGKIWGAK